MFAPRVATVRQRPLDHALSRRVESLAVRYTPGQTACTTAGVYAVMYLSRRCICMFELQRPAVSVQLAFFTIHKKQ